MKEFRKKVREIKESTLVNRSHIRTYRKTAAKEMIQEKKELEKLVMQGEEILDVP